MPNNSYILQGIDVHKSFGLTPALQGANIGVKRGEILAIMGASGSGKSTLLHCLAGIFLPDSGEIWFDGKRLDTLDETYAATSYRFRFCLPVRSIGARADR